MRAALGRPGGERGEDVAEPPPHPGPCSLQCPRPVSAVPTGGARGEDVEAGVVHVLGLPHVLRLQLLRGLIQQLLQGHHAGGVRPRAQHPHRDAVLLQAGQDRLHHGKQVWGGGCGMGWGQALGMAPVPPTHPQACPGGAEAGDPHLWVASAFGDLPPPRQGTPSPGFAMGQGDGARGWDPPGHPQLPDLASPPCWRHPSDPPSTALCPTPSWVAILGSVPLPPPWPHHQYPQGTQIPPVPQPLVPPVPWHPSFLCCLSGLVGTPGIPLPPPTMPLVPHYDPLVPPSLEPLIPPS